MTKLLGFQLGAPALSVQGDDCDPTGKPSFEILAAAEAIDLMRRYPHQFSLVPIYEGDIEEPILPP
jgi:hypothetical protein